MPFPLVRSHMVTLDIPCPECGRTEPVEKMGIGAYRCRDCESRFNRDDIDVPG